MVTTMENAAAGLRGCKTMRQGRGLVGVKGDGAKVVDDEVAERHERPAKYSWTEHAERNAIYNAAKLGIGLDGCTAYVNWFPCIDCARAIVQAGVLRLVGLQPDHADVRWGSEFEFASGMLGESGIEVTLYDFPDLVARR